MEIPAKTNGLPHTINIDKPHFFKLWSVTKLPTTTIMFTKMKATQLNTQKNPDTSPIPPSYREIKYDTPKNTGKLIAMPNKIRPIHSAFSPEIPFPASPPKYTRRRPSLRRLFR